MKKTHSHMIMEKNIDKDKGLENPKNNKNQQMNREKVEKKFETFINEKKQETISEVQNEEEITYKLAGFKKVGFWNVNQKKDGITDILKIANFDIIGLNEVGKEVILDDYTSFIVKEGDKITCQLLCKKEIKVKEM